LLELAGCQEDRLGINIVSRLDKGGCAEGTDIQSGDSHFNVAIVKKNASNDRIATEGEEISIGTECLEFSSTIVPLPLFSLFLHPIHQFKFASLTIKQICRKPKVDIDIQYQPSQQQSDSTQQLFRGENLHQALLLHGMKLNDDLTR
jgi:hypothetical protein